MDASLTLLCLVTKLHNTNTSKKSFTTLFMQNLMEKTVLHEEIPVNEWLKKIKYVKLGRNYEYSDYKELKFWV